MTTYVKLLLTWMEANQSKCQAIWWSRAGIEPRVKHRGWVLVCLCLRAWWVNSSLKSTDWDKKTLSSDTVRSWKKGTLKMLCTKTKRFTASWRTWKIFLSVSHWANQESPKILGRRNCLKTMRLQLLWLKTMSCEGKLPNWSRKKPISRWSCNRKVIEQYIWVQRHMTTHFNY